MPKEGPKRRSALVSYVQSDLCLQIIDRVIPDDRHAEFERQRGIFRQLSPYSGIEWQEQPAGLTGDRVAVIDADVGARIESDEPVVGKTEVKGRRKLKIADISSGRIAGEADVVPDHRLEIAG